ncbi:MAG: threonine-phosphate decarboxylase CobD [Pseudomonadota bacterium]
MKREILLHGGAIDLMKARFPDAPSPWIDLSTGINPWPYEFSVEPQETMNHLPTVAQFESCAAAMASAIGANADSLVLAPGSELLIRLLPTVLSVQRVCVTAQSYGDHISAWRSADVAVNEVLDPLAEIDHCDAVVVCNPNNPDGRCWSASELNHARERLAEMGGWLIVDEAYMDLHPEQSILTQTSTDGLIVLRSFGKFYGLAGVRLGALFAPRRILKKMSERLGVWPVPGPTLAIGTEAYDNFDWQIETRRQLSSARAKLDEVLTRHGLEVVGGTDLFRFVSTPSAETWWNGLAEQGIYTRRFNWCSRRLRIGLPASQDALTRLDGALERINPLK